MTYAYDPNTGDITDAEDGQLVATTSDSCTPEQARILTASAEMLTVILALLRDPYLADPINNERMAAARAVCTKVGMQP